MSHESCEPLVAVAFDVQIGQEASQKGLVLDVDQEALQGALLQDGMSAEQCIEYPVIIKKRTGEPLAIDTFDAQQPGDGQGSLIDVRIGNFSSHVTGERADTVAGDLAVGGMIARVKRQELERGREVVFDGKSLTPQLVAAIAKGKVESISLDPAALARVNDAHQAYRSNLRGFTIYGGNSGLGAKKTIRLNEKNTNPAVTIAATATSTCALGQLEPGISKAMLAIQINNFLAGGVGAVRPELVEKLANVFNATAIEDFPRVPALGNGHGDLNSAAAFAKWWMDKDDDFTLESGEDLALIAGNYYPEAMSAVIVARVERLLDVGYHTFALTNYAFDSQSEAFDPRVAIARPIPKLRDAIERIRIPLEGGGLPRRKCRNLQDPISFRSFPQVSATVESQREQLLDYLSLEINSSAQNPYSDKSTGGVVHNANFDTTQHSVTLSALQLALVKYADISFKRLSKLSDPHFNGATDGFGDEGLSKSGVQSYNLTNIAGQALLNVIKEAQSNLTDSLSMSFQNSIEDSVSGLFQQVLNTSRLVDSLCVLVACELVTSIAGIRHKIDNGSMVKDELSPQLVKVYDKLHGMIKTSGITNEAFDLDTILDCLDDKDLFPASPNFYYGTAVLTAENRNQNTSRPQSLGSKAIALV